MTPTHLIRFTKTLVFAVLVAALAVPAIALGGSNLSKPAPDWFERYAAAHAYGQGTLAAAQPQLTDGRSPDTLEAAAAGPLQVADGRSADTLDAALRPQPVAVVQPGKFDWADAGIGAATGITLIMLIGSSILLLMRRQRHHQVRAT